MQCFELDATYRWALSGTLSEYALALFPAIKCLTGLPGDSYQRLCRCLPSSSLLWHLGSLRVGQLPREGEDVSMLRMARGRQLMMVVSADHRT